MRMKVMGGIIFLAWSGCKVCCCDSDDYFGGGCGEQTRTVFAFLASGIDILAEVHHPLVCSTQNLLLIRSSF